jgi:hypothetical protein
MENPARWFSINSKKKSEMKKLLLAGTGYLMLLQCVFAQDVDVSQAPAVKTFSLQADNIGAVASTVNMFTGDLNLPLNLLTLPGRNGLDVSVSIGYTSNVSQSVSLWNLESPTGVLGLGWNMDLPKITCDNKSTGSREDDDYYLIEGGIANKLIRTTAGSDAQGPYYVYQTKKFRFWSIKFYYDPAEMFLPGTGTNKWEITREDGSRVTYGDKNSARETIEYVVCWGNWIGSSSATSGQSLLANAWNLSEITSLWGDKVKFKYEQVKQFVGSTAGQQHTEASYLKEITDVLGKKVQFIYNEKESQFFAEPHTERAEPDAYQEYYERKYLDRIDVLDEAAVKFMSLQFSYGSINDATNRAKKILTSVQQFNASMNSMPAIKLSYVTSGVFQGMLNKVTYPTGGTATYNYSLNEIYRSARDLQIDAPAGYGEPKIWMGEDYAVVCWRQETSNGGHDEAARPVRMFVYQWLGEWKEVYQQSVGNVEAILSHSFPLAFEYKNFSVSTSDDFFSLMYNVTGNTYRCFMFRKNPATRGGWVSFSRDLDVGPGKPTLIVSDKYVAVGTEERDIFMFTYNGSGWNESTIEQTPWGSNFDYTGENNFLIRQREAEIFPVLDSEIAFSYLTEDKNWVTRYLSSSLTSNGLGGSLWYSSRGMAFTMAANAKERVYRWSGDYNTFYMDVQDNYGNDLFGSQDHAKKLSMIDNAFIATGQGWLARFDGVEWWTNRLTHEESDYFNYAFGSDIGITPNRSLGASGWEGRRKIFDPNSRQWSEYMITTPDAGNNFADVGIDCYYYGNGYFYRQPNGAWSKIHTYSTNADWRSYGGYPRFQLRCPALTGNEQVEFVNFKNGQKLPSIVIPGYYVFYHGDISMLPSHAEGNNMFALIEYPDNWPNNGDWQAMPFVDRIRLYKIVNDGISARQKDVVVSSISLATSDKVEYTAFQYTGATAAMDPSGISAQYYEVFAVPGVTNAAIATRPFGYTKYFFANGLSADERFASSTLDYRLTGLPIETQVYNANGIMVSSSKTTYTVYNKDFLNTAGQKVETGSYSLPTQIVQAVDGVTTTTTNTYDSNTGQLQKTVVSGSSTVETQYKYFWEFYDPGRSLNILPAIAQVKTLVNGTVVSSKATRYKLWNGTFSGVPVWAPFDQYGWAGTNSADFTLWRVDQGTPGTDWIFGGHVAERGLVSGMTLENVSSGRSVSSVLFDASTNQIIAEVNASLADVAHTSFEKGYTGNFTYSDVPITGVSKTGTKHLELLGTISKADLNPGKTYTLSFWAKGTNCVVSVSGIGNVNLGTLSDWTLFQYNVTGVSSIVLQKVSGAIFLDEVRLHPKGSLMVTTTHHPLYGVQSAMDANHQLVKTEFDEWGRTLYTTDDKGNILSIHSYNYKN